MIIKVTENNNIKIIDIYFSLFSLFYELNFFFFFFFFKKKNKIKFLCHIIFNGY